MYVQMSYTNWLAYSHAWLSCFDDEHKDDYLDCLYSSAIRLGIVFG